MFVLGSTSLADEPETAIPERIEARAFVVKDADNHLWGVFGMDAQAKPEPSLVLNPMSSSGLIVALQDNPETPHHVVIDLTSGNQYAELGNNDNWGSFLHLTDVAGNLRLVFTTRAQEALGGDASTWGKEPWPALIVNSEKGSLRGVFAATPKGAVCEVYDAQNTCVFRHGAGAPDVRGMPEMSPQPTSLSDDRARYQADRATRDFEQQQSGNMGTLGLQWTPQGSGYGVTYGPSPSAGLPPVGPSGNMPSASSPGVSPWGR